MYYHQVWVKMMICVIKNYRQFAIFFEYVTLFRRSFSDWIVLSEAFSNSTNHERSRGTIMSINSQKSGGRRSGRFRRPKQDGLYKELTPLKRKRRHFTPLLSLLFSTKAKFLLLRRESITCDNF